MSLYIHGTALGNSNIRWRVLCSLHNIMLCNIVCVSIVDISRKIFLTIGHLSLYCLISVFPSCVFLLCRISEYVCCFITWTGIYSIHFYRISRYTNHYVVSSAYMKDMNICFNTKNSCYPRQQQRSLVTCHCQHIRTCTWMKKFYRGLSLPASIEESRHLRMTFCQRYKLWTIINQSF